MIHLFQLLNLLSTLVVTLFLLNSLLSHGGIEGGSTVKLEDRGANYFKRQNSARGVNGVNHYTHHGENVD
jgi:hypothetical protein